VAGLALIGERRALIFLIVQRNNSPARRSSGGWSRNHGGKPMKSAAAAIDTDQPPRLNKPNRVDRLGKHRVHQY